MERMTRKQAGNKLADKIKASRIKVDIVLCCSPEGFEVSEELAKKLDTELDLRFTESITVPENEVILAGVADDGTVWVDQAIKDEYKVSGAFIDRARIVKARILGLEKSKYSGKNTLLTGKRVLLTDDIILDSNRIAAALGSVVKQGAMEAYVAAPVISESSLAHLEEISDGVFRLQKNENNEISFSKEPDTDKLEEYDF